MGTKTDFDLKYSADEDYIEFFTNSNEPLEKKDYRSKQLSPSVEVYKNGIGEIVGGLIKNVEKLRDLDDTSLDDPMIRNITNSVLSGIEYYIDRRHFNKIKVYPRIPTSKYTSIIIDENMEHIGFILHHLDELFKKQQDQEQQRKGKNREKEEKQIMNKNTNTNTDTKIERTNANEIIDSFLNEQGRMRDIYDLMNEITKKNFPGVYELKNSEEYNKLYIVCKSFQDENEVQADMVRKVLFNYLSENCFWIIILLQDLIDQRVWPDTEGIKTPKMLLKAWLEYGVKRGYTERGRLNFYWGENS